MSQLEAEEMMAGRDNRGHDDEERICDEANVGGHRQQEEVSLRISPVFVLVFVVLMCTMLVLLYFFFDKLGKPKDNVLYLCRTAYHQSMSNCLQLPQN